MVEYHEPNAIARMTFNGWTKPAIKKVLQCTSADIDAALAKADEEARKAGPKTAIVRGPLRKT